MVDILVKIAQAIAMGQQGLALLEQLRVLVAQGVELVDKFWGDVSWGDDSDGGMVFTAA